MAGSQVQGSQRSRRQAALMRKSVIIVKALLVIIGYIGVSALLGVLVRRWWLLAVVLVLWIVMVGDALSRDDFISYENTRAGYVLLTASAFLIPAELGAALGILLGRRWLPLDSSRAAQS